MNPNLLVTASTLGREDRMPLSPKNANSIVAGTYNRIAVDISQLQFAHARLDENGRYESTINSSLNDILTLEANIDQTAKAFLQDVTLTLLDRGHAVVIPTRVAMDASRRVTALNEFRVGYVVEWGPTYVGVNFYDETKGIRRDAKFGKRDVAIIENPLYSVLNAPNSIAQRIITRLNALDVVDGKAANGRLDIMIGVPYTITSDAVQARVDSRLEAIERQLETSAHGIAMIDGLEKVTQLNRAAENQLLAHINALLPIFYGQLGMSEAIFNGTESETEHLNYVERSIKPIANAIADSFRRIFLTKNARTRGETVMWFMQAFSHADTENVIKAADTLIRSAVLSPNEFRSILGYKPDPHPESNDLGNRNLKADDILEAQPTKKEETNQNGSKKVSETGTV